MPLYLRRKLLEDIEIRLAKIKAFSKIKMTKTIIERLMERLEQIKVIANNLKTGFTKAVKALL